ncbi:unnamed protein product, partial [Leptidea sinapis]
MLFVAARRASVTTSTRPLLRALRPPQPFTAAPMTSSVAPMTSPAAAAPPVECEQPPAAGGQGALLAREPWFHGVISRSAAERLVVEDGEFLVRESSACPGQFVLTGARKGQHKHLLLVDPNGV